MANRGRLLPIRGLRIVKMDGISSIPPGFSAAWIRRVVDDRAGGIIPGDADHLRRGYARLI